MKKKLAMMIAGAALAGCTPSVESVGPKASAPSEQTVHADALAGEWMLECFDGKPVASDQLRIRAAQEHIEASINCNTARITYTISEDNVLTPSTLTTEIGCAPPFQFDVPITRMLERPMKVRLNSSNELYLTGAHELRLRRTT